MMQKVPTTIVTGFLGSGKTTIILGLVSYLQQKQEKIAYIKNEIGALETDGTILVGKNITAKELLNGCICCTLVGPFLSAIDEIIDVINPTRIFIEASGLAEPAALALMVSTHAKLLRDGLITVIDVVNFEGFSNLSFSAKEQAKFTDLLVFNKVENVSLERKKTVVGFVRELNEFAPIVEAQHGLLNPQLAFGISSNQLNNLLEDKKQQDHLDHQHLSDENVSIVTIDIPMQITEEKITKWVNDLPLSVIRVKGIVKTEKGNTIVNCVGKRIQFSPIDFDYKGKLALMIVGFGLEDMNLSINDIVGE